MGVRLRFWLVALVALVAAIAVASPSDALAQRRRPRRSRPSGAEATSPPGVDPQLDREARQLFLAGETAYDAGRYEAALEYFTRAHSLSGRAGLLFNIASAAERLRRDPEALAAYEQYLRDLPEAPNRAFAEQRIAFLREQLAREAELREAAARAAQPPVVEAPRMEAPLDEDEPQPATSPSGEPRAALDLGAQATDTAALTVPAAALDPSVGGERDDDESLAEQWWFWTIVGVAVVGTGVGVGAAIAAASDGGGASASPAVTGDFGPGGVVIALEAF